MIKHVSFDMWDTLITHNPEFREARLKLIKKVLYNLGRRLVEEVDIKQYMGDIGSFNTTMSMITEQHALQKEVMYAQLLSRFNVPINYGVSNKLEEFVESIDKLCEKHPPLFIEPKTLMIIEELKSEGFGVSVVSNTGFIDGKDLTTFLQQRGLMKFIDKTYFSDQIGLAKPNCKLFTRIVRETGLEPDQVLHVGDNVIADGGCRNIGMNFFYLNNNMIGENATLMDVLEEVLKTNKDKLSLNKTTWKK